MIKRYKIFVFLYFLYRFVYNFISMPIINSGCITPFTQTACTATGWPRFS